MEKDIKTGKNQFLRTVAGKTLLFAVINLAAIIGFLCAAGAVAAIYADIYGKTEDEYYSERNDSYTEELVMFDTYRLMTSQFNGIELMPIMVTDNSGNIVASTPDFDLAEETAGQTGKYQNYSLYTYNVRLIYSSDGNLKGIYGSYGIYDSGTDTIVNGTVKAYADPAMNLSLNYFETTVVHLLFNVRFLVYPVGFICLLILIASFIALMCVSGKQPGTEEVKLGPLGGFPFDVLMLVSFFLGVFAILIVNAVNGLAEAILAIVTVLIAFNVFLGLCVSFAARVKLGVLIKGTVIYKVFSLIGKLFKLIFKGILAIPLVWQAVLAMAGIAFIELVGIACTNGEPDNFALCWILEKLILYPFIFFVILMMRKLKISGDKLAQGDITYRTSTKGLWGDFKKHANNLNSVADSVTIAVEDRLKSERMKTELITNVSHDIKTPLTSIINYASLIGNAEPDDPKLNEYSEVIVRQSEKLKRLIEDLVEASKASSGNLEIVPAPLDCCTFISQTAGEYKERLEGCNLTLVTNTPEESVMINADGRRMMRIYDNLMNNICKYSQPGTRVYLTLEKKDGKAVTTFKNTSSAELNISPDELVERFVRGDQSRNTEGNGLGLSIAKSMTELQGGTFDIAIDGDLFKVTLSFPVIV